MGGGVVGGGVVGGKVVGGRVVVTVAVKRWHRELYIS